MSISAKIAHNITNEINSELSYDQVQLEQIEYGLDSFISNVGKTMLILFLAYVFGYFREILIVSIVFGLLRSAAGGVHAKTSLGCFVSSSIIYSSITYLSGSIYLASRSVSIIFIVAFFVILMYAPADVANKPIRGQKRKRMLKIVSIIIPVILYGLTFFLFSKLTVNLIVFSVIAECLTITPIAYNITNSKRGDAYEETVEESNDTIGA